MKKIPVPVVVVLVFLFFSGCSSQDVPQENNGVVESPSPETGETKYFSFAEVSSHSTQDDCWFVINGKVYNVTSFVSSHPGGNAILEGCGKGATELFETRPMGSGTPHSEKARSRLEEYYLGELLKAA